MIEVINVRITAASLASMEYNIYSLANSNSQARSIDDNLTKSLYNVSDLSNALNSLNNPVSLDEITTVDDFAKNSYMLSQSQLYNSSGTLNTRLTAGTVDNYYNLNYLAQSSNLTESNIDLSSIINIQETAADSALTSSLSNKIGSLLDVTA